MSQENVQEAHRTAVRSPVSVRETSRRSLDQRLFLRFPSLGTFSARVFSRLPPASRLRRAQLQRAMRLGVEAYNRRDLTALLSGYHRDAQMELAQEVGGVANSLAQPAFKVSEGLERFWREFFDAWGEFRIEPQEVLDLGDQVVLLGHVVGQGVSSGVRLSDPYAAIFTFEQGKVIKHREYGDHAEALEPVGLRG